MEDPPSTGVVESGIDPPTNGNGGGRNPYQGLDYYTEDDAKWFFGRRSERNRIISNLRTSRLTVLYAESGVGKSSLLRAGAVARLRELARDDIERRGSARFVPVVFSDWQDEPSDHLNAFIEREAARFALPVGVPAGRPASRASDSRVHDAQPGRPGENGEPATTVPENDLARAIARAVDSTDATVLIILDQFEEHFRYRGRQSAPERIANEIAACVNAPALAVHFLIAVREDAYGGLGDLFRGRVGNVYRNYMHLEYLTREAAREAIEEPINRYNDEHSGEPAITVGKGLTDAVLGEVRRGNLVLGPGPDESGPTETPTASTDDEIEAPFLQLVMKRLWECEQQLWKRERNQDSRMLRKATLNETLGGAERIVRDHLTDAVGDLTSEDLVTAKLLFRELVTPSGAKIAHTAADLVGLTERPQESVASVLKTLDDERIVRAVDAAPPATETRYEIFHDKLADAIVDWLGQQKTEQLLLEKEKAEEDKQRAEEETRIQTEQARIQKEQADRLRVLNLRFRMATILLAGALLIAAVLAVVALKQKSTADSERAAADSASARAMKSAKQAAYSGLTSSAASQLSSRPDVALLLYLAAYGEISTPLAERRLIATFQDVQMSGAEGILHGQSEAIEGLAFSPHGPTLASASGDGTIRLWHVDQSSWYPLGKPLKAGGPVFSVAFSPDGSSLASGSLNNLIVWNVASGRRVRTKDLGGTVTSVAYSPDGRWLAASNLNGSVLLLDTHSGRAQMLMSRPAEPVRSVAFSRNSDLLAAGELGGKVVLWNVATGRPIRTLLDHRSDVYAVAFRPTGDTLAAAGAGSKIVLWNLADHDRVQLLRAGRDPFIYSLAFAPSGRALAAGGTGEVLLWNPTTGGQIGARLTGQRGAVYAVSFSADGRTLVSAGADRTIRVWRYGVRPQYGVPMTPSHAQRVLSVAVARNGLIASGSSDGKIFVVGGVDHTPVTISAPKGLAAIAFADGDRVLASAGSDGLIRLWNPITGRPTGKLLPARPRRGILALASDPAGTTLVSGGADGNVRVWNVLRSGEVGPPLTVGLGGVFAVAFHPQTKAIAAAGNGRTIRIWKAGAGGWLPSRAIGQDAALFALAFSPDGRKLASAGADGTIRLWNLTASPSTSPTTLIGHTGFVRGLAFSPDGKSLASAGADQTVRIWDVDGGTELGDPLTGDKNTVESVAFSPDGKFLVSGSDDQTVRKWQAGMPASSFPAFRNRVCRFLGAGLNRTEWNQYARGIGFLRTCTRLTPG